ncbi:MAG: RNA polymerase sigma-70 factor [Cytophagales bacterium]|nr:RNA polymerase sigma-70 factor [Cytophagales bacterium]
MKSSLEDQVRLLKKGSPHAFESIFKTYAPKILNFTAKYFEDIQDCEEIAQEVFIKIWNKREAINDPKTFESLLFTIAKNHIYNAIRKKVYQKAFKDKKTGIIQMETFDPEDEQNFAELFVMIKAITKSLPHQRRKVFILSRLKGYTNKEIAKRLGISINTVETHIRLALKKFREVLKENNFLSP